MHSCLRESADAPGHDVRLWTAHLESLSSVEVEDLSAHLDVAERARGAQFHFARDQQHYMATRGLLRCLLGALLDEPAATIVFTYGMHGKPALATRGGRCSIHFNLLADSAGWAMFAVAQDHPVGIDLESAARLDQNDEYFPGSPRGSFPRANWRSGVGAPAYGDAPLGVSTRVDTQRGIRQGDGSGHLRCVETSR